MSQARIEMNAVILPNGKVLALGGSLNDEEASSASLNADLLRSADPTHFTSMAPNASMHACITRMRLLLPDATVWFAGGNPARGTYEQHMEIYQPPYLFNSNGALATRPTITALPAAIAWGGAFTVTTPDAANISSAVLMRPGSPTHAFDMDQRLVGMSFTEGSGIADGNCAAERQHRPAGILHAVPAEQQRRAFGGKIHPVGSLKLGSGTDGDLDHRPTPERRTVGRQ